MARYILNTPIKVSKTKILKPSDKPRELSDKIVESLPPGALTLVKEPKPAPNPAPAKSGSGKTGDGEKK